MGGWEECECEWGGVYGGSVCECEWGRSLGGVCMGEVCVGVGGGDSNSKLMS